MGTIFNKTIEYFKENPKTNTYILSIICNNIPYLNYKYSEFILKYYNEMSLVIDPSNPRINYNTFNHLYSFCLRLEIKLFIHYFVSKLYYTFTFIYILYKRYREKICFRMSKTTLLSIIIIFAMICFSIFLIFIIKLHNTFDLPLFIITIFMPSVFLFFVKIAKDFFQLKPTKPTLVFLIPFPYYVSYPSEYSWVKNFFIPQSSPFTKTNNIEFYKLGMVKL